MEFTDRPFEQTTAVTDLILAMLASVLAYRILRYGRGVDLYKSQIWAWAFGLIAFASYVGAVAHGFDMSDKTNWILWQPLNLSLGLAVALFVTGVIYDMKGFWISRGMTLAILLLGTMFYAITLVFDNLFVIFVLYEAVAMVFAVIVYTMLAVKNELHGAGYMTIGIMISLFAAYLQTQAELEMVMIWEFDHNGIFHIAQMIGIVFLAAGIRKDLRSRARRAFSI